MGRVSESAMDVEDLYNIGLSTPEIARRLKLAEFFVAQVVADLTSDDQEEERHPWQD